VYQVGKEIKRTTVRVFVFV